MLAESLRSITNKAKTDVSTEKPSEKPVFNHKPFSRLRYVDDIGEQSSYGRCSADWRKARKEIEADEKMKKELVAKLKTLV